MGTGLVPLMTALPTSLELVSALLCYMSLQLFFSRQFRMNITQFSFISILVLGGDGKKIHLLYCHLDLPPQISIRFFFIVSLFIVEITLFKSLTCFLLIL